MYAYWYLKQLGDANHIGSIFIHPLMTLSVMRAALDDVIAAAAAVVVVVVVHCGSMRKTFRHHTSVMTYMLIQEPWMD
jgi:hypothetical protein